MKKYLFASLQVLLFISCGDEPQMSQTIEIQEVESMMEVKPYRFECFKRDTNPNRFGVYTLFFCFSDNKIAIDNIPACGRVTQNQWNKIGIPESAVDVRGGKWASGAAYYYAERDSTDFIIFKISADELDGEPGPPVEVYRVKDVKLEI